jgi:hypothetical protein
MAGQTGQIFAFAFSVTLPIFVIVLLGAWLKRINFINAEFIRIASNLVFNIGLPATLFFGTVKTDFSNIISPTLLGIMVLMTLLVFIFSMLSARLHVAEKSEHGLYVQGAFRGNLVIVGLAFCANAYGDIGLATAAIPVAILIILYNVLSVYVLNITLKHSGNTSARKILTDILKNPLILGILAGLLVNLAGFPLPKLVLETGGYFSQMTLPLALLCIGGAMDLSALRLASGAAVGSTIWKLVMSPLLVLIIAIPMGIRDMELDVLFFLAASPTAAASFVMAKSMGGNASLAANIVVLTTLGALFTVTGGLIALKYAGLV